MVSHSLIAGRSVVLYRLLSGLVPPALSEICPILSQGAQGPPATPFWQNYQNHESLLTFTLSFLFSPPLEQTPTLSSIPLFPQGFPNSRSLTTISHLSPCKTTIFSTPVNPPQTHVLQIPCFPFLKVPVVSILHTPYSPPPSLSLPQISSYLCSPLLFSFPLPPLLSAATLVRFCV